MRFNELMNFSYVEKEVTSMGFTEAHEIYMKEHLAVREGERGRRLLEGHGYAEKWFLEAV